MPFDYLWQFLNYPITNQEFFEGKIQQNKSKPFFSFKDTLEIYESQNQIEQLSATAYRVEKNGVKNSMVFDRLQHLKLEIERDRQNKIVNLYNSAVATYNEGINYLNDFIDFRNKQFTPHKSDNEIQQMLNDVDNILEAATKNLEQITDADTSTESLIKQLSKAIDAAVVQTKEQQDWLKQYLSKNKTGRKSMFYKVTWFGIPLN